jgi:hypothetical protein
MAQAGGTPPAAPAAAPQPHYAAAAVNEATGEVVADVVHEEPSQQPIAEPKVSRDWAALAAAITDIDALTKLFQLASEEGEVGLVLPCGLTVDATMRKRRSELAQVPLVDVPAARPPKRQWVREARLLATRDEVRALYMEATAAGALVQILEEIESIERTLPDPGADVASEGGGWATPGEPSVEWAAEPVDDDSETVAGVLDDSIGGDR